jgi:RimJ/RimL family protein N-acetyltransferase
VSARSAEVVAETLRTARLDLVPFDLDFCRAILAGDRAFAAEWLGADLGAWPGTDEADGFFPIVTRALREDSSVARWWGRAVVVRMFGAVVGSVGLKGQPRGGRVEIGWGIERPFRGQGYAREAARAVVADAFMHREVAEVVAEIDLANAPSIAVAEAIGMRRTGETSTQDPGAMYWSISRVEFEASGQPPRG